ncbi:MAG: tetratricopeptide repeat protein [Gammaproteobacteria bacterium]|nr:tetratricopeptide repeat protein [Gammaproteobacteria bacterium]
MSLLMDALKKAEQEKKEAARRLQEAQAKAGLELESAEQNIAGTTSSSVKPDKSVKEDKTTEPPQGTPITKKVTPNLSLEPVDAIPANISEQEDSTEEVTELNAVKADVPALSEDITLEHPKVPDVKKEKVQPAGMDQTFSVSGLSLEKEATTPVEVTAKSAQPDYADTISESRISRTIVSAAQLAKDIGGGRDQPTPVAAQTIFAAVGSSDTRQILRWSIFLGLCMVIIVATGTFYYLTITPLTPDSSMPSVAKGIETDPVLPPVIEIPEVESTDTIAGEAISAEELPVGDISQMESTTGPANQTQEDTVESDSTVSDVAVTETPDESMSGMQEAETAIALNQPVEETPIVTAPESVNTLPDEIDVEPRAIEISRSKSIDKKGEMINLAYAEYMAGNFAVAEAGYLNVLKETPDNRDALLGLAAIAYRNGDLQGAYEGYLKVLKLYPNDSVAKTALINLQGRNNPARSESIVKLLLQEDPEAPFLHFTLGNLYAAQSRWADAQQAFFDAYQLESDNPDYAYNLAVSLDHIGQASTALNYYNTALELADKTQVNFNTASVITRIDALTGLTRSN